MSEVSIRDAEPGDAAAVERLIEDLGYELTLDDCRRRLSQILGRADHAAYVATVAGRVAGFIHISLTESLEHEPRGEIRTLSVGEEHRGGGIGALLLDAAERWAKSRGMLRVRVRSNVKRERARKFYDRHGYEVVKSQNVFDKTLQ